MRKQKRILFLILTLTAGLVTIQLYSLSEAIEKVIDIKVREQELRRSFTSYSRKAQVRHKPTLSRTYHHKDSDSSISFWEYNLQIAERIIKANGPSKVRKIITAYLEAPLNDTIPGTGEQTGGGPNSKSTGTPPQFYTPMPLRLNTPFDLKKYEYPKFQTCHDLPSKLPVDRGLELNENGKTIVRNLGNTPTRPDFPWLEASYCPVDADPFLPWIHDVFPNVDGTRIEFIAQNKRRCKSGFNFLKDSLRLTPQVALLQPVSVERIDEERAKELAPELWRPKTEKETNETWKIPRYRLAPYEEASIDGMWTRFICRFHTTDFINGQSIILNETLSEYPYNYELASYRKGRAELLNPRGRETDLFWTSTLMFSCPVPKNLQSLVRDGLSILSDGSPTLFVDIIPIRTSVRYGSKEIYFTEKMAGPKSKWDTSGKLDTFNTQNMTSTNGFNATFRWGHNHVLPKVEASGRWANLPVCQAPKPSRSNAKDIALPSKERTKPNTLIACLWASASFNERGMGEDHQIDTIERLKEWIEFHLMVGFDHIYVYDNSGAQTNETDLAGVTSKFPKTQVTRIEWPSIVCNNNSPGHPNVGERSSQYAAENSCRTRFGPLTEWIASFDTDEYLVPMGNYTSLKDLVQDAQKHGTNILSLRSSRGRIRHHFTRDGKYYERKGGKIQKSIETRDKLPNVTYLEAYNCDSVPIPKPKFTERAKKQIYRADYVLNHFVHYSTTTKKLAETYEEAKQTSGKWPRWFREGAPSERFTDEVGEAVMVHTKKVTWKQSRDYKTRCHVDARKDNRLMSRGCYIGFPSPNGTAIEGEHGGDGMEYNCYINQKVEHYWLPILKERMQKRWETNSE